MQLRARLTQKEISRRVHAPAGVPLRAPWHPGHFLRRNFLIPVGMSQTEAARVLGVSRRRLHEIVQGHRSMTPDTAIRCALAFGTDAAFWLAMQAAWDNFHAWKSLRQQSRLTACTPAHPGLPLRWVVPSVLLASRFRGSL